MANGFGGEAGADTGRGLEEIGGDVVMREAVALRVADACRESGWLGGQQSGHSLLQTRVAMVEGGRERTRGGRRWHRLE